MPTGSWKHDFAEAPPRPTSDSSPSQRIVVSNLHYEVMPKDLVTIFESIGNLAREPSIRYDRSGRSLGIAYIVFSNPDDALMAKARLDGVSAKGKPMTITIEPIRQKNETPVGPRGTSAGKSTLLNRISSAPLLSRLDSSTPSDQPGQHRRTRGSRGTGTVTSSRLAAASSRPTKIHSKPKTAEDLDRELEAYLGDEKTAVTSPVTGDVDMA
ncbi:hypothetical protein BS47DRAFT_473769 [Hydnum rufescens UP504]|uniref:RRM domain-containing protein n=1 Tax=Hydnum rufescens UP504 TaxID=1448309 RepID=A0A9P6E055_9AGAM|nr:hypothetical protein BS47DRAFT_473769 [Hydnum rufescens UP504]